MPRNGLDRLTRFVDLHLKPPLQDVKIVERMACLAAEVGLHVVGIAFDLRTPREARLSAVKLFEDRGLAAMTRIDLRPKNRSDLLQSLRDVRALFDVVAVECSNTQVSSVAFRDRRVDLVFFPVGRLHSRLSWLIPKKLKRPIELNFADLLGNESSAGPGLVRAINLISEAQRKHMPLIASSGAADPFLIRAPRDMAAILFVLGLPSCLAVDAVSDLPYSLIRRNLERREPGFVSEGTRIVRART